MLLLQQNSSDEICDLMLWNSSNLQGKIHLDISAISEKLLMNERDFEPNGELPLELEQCFHTAGLSTCSRFTSNNQYIYFVADADATTINDLPPSISNRLRYVLHEFINQPNYICRHALEKHGYDALSAAWQILYLFDDPEKLSLLHDYHGHQSLTISGFSTESDISFAF